VGNTDIIPRTELFPYRRSHTRNAYRTRKLDEFARYLSTRAGKLPTPGAGYFSIGELLRLLEPPVAGERESYLCFPH